MLVWLHVFLFLVSIFPPSIVKDIKEALVQLLLPELALGGDTDDHKALVRSWVHVDELAFLGCEIGLARALGILIRLIELIGNGHVHLDLNSGQVHSVILVSYHQVLVAIVPEEWMRLDFNQLVRWRFSITISIVLEAVQMVKLDRDDRARLGVLNLERTIQDADLKPVITVELWDQLTSLVGEGELFRVPGEHDLGNVDAEELTLLGLAQAVEKDIVDSSFLATNDRFPAIFIQEHRLVLHVDLFLQLQVVLAEDEDLAFECHIDVRWWTDCREDLDSLALAVDCGNQTQIIWREEVDLVRVFPDKLVLVAL